jgi:diaminohydroxyphosphoribosylaminopyrimidine deaminase / 5-amino-6-(5-phosphoribosylamino)uracil reductase
MTTTPEPTLLQDPERNWLERAALAGRKGWGRVHPNPMVGCVLVKEGRVVGEGHHAEYGGPHAEVNALVEAGPEARGATAYVSLEPCNHQGKTPPCTQALLDAGVVRVVFGASDPGSESGGGAEALRSKGVEVVGPVFPRARARRENPVFFHVRENSTPFVALKLAISLDGMISERPGRRTDLSCPEALAEVHRLRAGFEGIMVGGRTALVDDPLLTVRGEVVPRKPPLRIVLDPDAMVPSTSALFRTTDEAPVLVFTGETAPMTNVGNLRDRGATVERIQGAPEGLDLSVALAHIRELGIESVFCEGGGRLATSLLKGGYVGRLYYFVAPRTLGPAGVPAFPEPFGRTDWRGWQAVDAGTAGSDAFVVFDRES